MAVTTSGHDLQSEEAVSAVHKEKKHRSKCPGVRLVGSRIYDSQNGKTCHQCRQKTRDFTAGCKNEEGNKQCTINYCHKCLLNRYGEKAEEVALLDDWKCPKCRGICNCSFCMKKRGHKPTGILVHTAKENGFSSVSELLQVKGPENFCVDRLANDADVSSKKPASTKESIISSARKAGKENSFEGNNNLSMHSENLTPVSENKKSKKMKREESQEVNSNMNDNASIGKSGGKKPKRAQEGTENKANNKKDESVLVEKSKSKAQSEYNPKKEVKKVEKDEGVSVEKSKSKAQSEHIPKTELRKVEKDEGVLVEKRKSKAQSKHIPNKGVKKVEKEEGVLVEKSKYAAQSEYIPTKEIKNVERNGGVLVERSKHKAQSEHSPKNEVKKVEKDEGIIVKAKKFKAKSQDFFEKKNNSQMPKDVDICHSENQENAENCKSSVENDNLKTKNKTAIDSCTMNMCVIGPQSKQIEDGIALPSATCLTTVRGIELPHEDAGHALQFFEFCAAFGEVIDLKKGQAEAMIREIRFGRRGRRSQGSLLVQFHIKLLSLIQEDLGEYSPAPSSANGQNSWLKALGKCVSKCKFLSGEFPFDFFDRGNEKYDILSSSQKFKLLNFLCDEALNTKDLRCWIDDQNSKFVKREKEARDKVLAARDKEKQLKQKMQAEVAKAIIAKNGAPFSISEHALIVSQIKKEAAQAHTEMLEAKGTVPEKRQRSDAVRTDPILLDVNGCAFWRLKGYNDQPDILLQDMGSWSSAAPEEKWFVYDAEQTHKIEKYISLRTKRLRIQTNS